MFCFVVIVLFLYFLLAFSAVSMKLTEIETAQHLLNVKFDDRNEVFWCSSKLENSSALARFVLSECILVCVNGRMGKCLCSDRTTKKGNNCLIFLSPSEPNSNVSKTESELEPFTEYSCTGQIMDNSISTNKSVTTQFTIDCGMWIIIFPLHDDCVYPLLEWSNNTARYQFCLIRRLLLCPTELTISPSVISVTNSSIELKWSTSSVNCSDVPKNPNLLYKYSCTATKPQGMSKLSS